MEYEEKIGKLIPKTAHQREAYDTAKMLRDNLLSLPSKLAPIVSAESNEQKNFETIRKEVKRVIREIQRRMVDIGRSEKLL